mmetsp:Transcript_80147/g.214125  ORF Transcript_80147/g.214125 Transcript_80147/m.214125 type:complete len:549 (+) Transcript_80147:25-1671(+)
MVRHHTSSPAARHNRATRVARSAPQQWNHEVVRALCSRAPKLTAPCNKCGFRTLPCACRKEVLGTPCKDPYTYQEPDARLEVEAEFDNHQRPPRFIHDYERLKKTRGGLGNMKLVDDMLSLNFLDLTTIEAKDQEAGEAAQDSQASSQKVARREGRRYFLIPTETIEVQSCVVSPSRPSELVFRKDPSPHLEAGSVVVFSDFQKMQGMFSPAGHKILECWTPDSSPQEEWFKVNVKGHTSALCCERGRVSVLRARQYVSDCLDSTSSSKGQTNNLNDSISFRHKLDPKVDSGSLHGNYKTAALIKWVGTASPARVSYSAKVIKKECLGNLAKARATKSEMDKVLQVLRQRVQLYQGHLKADKTESSKCVYDARIQQLEKQIRDVEKKQRDWKEAMESPGAEVVRRQAASADKRGLFESSRRPLEGFICLRQFWQLLQKAALDWLSIEDSVARFRELDISKKGYVAFPDLLLVAQQLEDAADRIFARHQEDVVDATGEGVDAAPTAQDPTSMWREAFLQLEKYNERLHTSYNEGLHSSESVELHETLRQ